MLNFNFLGLGSFSAALQKGKMNRVNSADSENSSAALGNESQISDAAFPDVLMQMLLGQQLPMTVQGKAEQQNSVDGEILASDKPLFTGSQPLSLREQLFAGEIKKQSALQKTSGQAQASEEIKTAIDQSENIGIAKLSLNELNVESATPITQGLKENIESLQTVIESKMDLQGMSVLPTQVLSSSIQQGENKNTTGGEVKPMIQGMDLNIPKLTKQTDNKADGKESESLNPSNSKLSPTNPFKNEIVQPDAVVPRSITYDKQETNKEFQQNEIVNADEVKAAHNKTTINKTDTISLTSNDFQQKGIISAVVTQSGKAAKNNNNESTLVEKSNSSEKLSSSTISLENDKTVNIVKNETQNSGNGSLPPKENFERQLSSEKDVAPIDVRQGQQLFSTVIEEKNNIVLSKTHQTEISSFLRQQDVVNNIVEQLAKNVTVSIHENNSQMKILLKPEALGDVMLKVTIDQGKVSTQMEVQQPQVKAVIEANLQILRDSLSSKGLVVDRIDISTAQYSLNEKSSHQGQQRTNLKNYSGKEIDEEVSEQTKLFGYNTVDYVA